MLSSQSRKIPHFEKLRDSQNIINKFNDEFDSCRKKIVLLSENAYRIINQQKILKELEAMSRIDSRYTPVCEKQREIYDNSKNSYLTLLNKLNERWNEIILVFYNHLRMNLIERKSGDTILRSQYLTWTRSVYEIYIEIEEYDLAKQTLDKAETSVITEYLQQLTGE